jgi:bifunctional DNA primase/polymerase-like protein
MDILSDLSRQSTAADELAVPADRPMPSGEFIPDRYLNQAIGACCIENGRLLVPKPVRNLIKSYSPPDRPTMNHIPQERRRQFLNELASITGRALPPKEPTVAEPELSLEKVLRAAPTPSPEKLFQVEPSMPAHEPIRVERISVSHDKTLIINGYEPIAVNGKVPVAKGWNKRPNTIEAIAAERAHHPGATNTGLRTGRLVGVDIDIVPPEHVEAIKRLAREILGSSLLERVGAKGAMLCYRNETPIEKITVSGKHSSIQPGKIEILGTGQQFVSYGVHPDTGKPNVWTNVLIDAAPLHTKLDELPEVTPDKLRDFAGRAAALMTALGYTDVKVSGTGEAAERVRLDAAVNLEFDLPVNIERARILLQNLVDRGDVAVEGQGGDARTFQVAYKLRDLGLSPQAALDLLVEHGGWNEHCQPPWEYRELAVKVRNAYEYAKNAPGADANLFPPLESHQSAAPLGVPQPAVAGETTSTAAQQAY